MRLFMVDFSKLRKKSTKPKSIIPSEIFRRLPKPDGINDLYASQEEILQSWYDRRNESDIVLKLHTGGGKTLVGLLIAQSTLNETGGPVLYLTPTNQLATQTLDKAAAHGIPAVPYERGQPLNDEFTNGNAIMVGNYNVLFNGKSKFGVRGGVQPQKVAAIILDDAHTAFSTIRETFTLNINSNDKRYRELADVFRKSFKDIEKLGKLEDILEGSDYSVLEVPYWAWHEQLDSVREQLRSDSEKYGLVWPLLRDNLHLCHALISKKNFSITPILPMVNMFPAFSEAPRRIYMSATIADDREIIRTFDADPNSIKTPLKSPSLAGISERMILIPELMQFDFEIQNAVKKLVIWTSNKKDYGSVILVPSSPAAQQWSDVAMVANDSKEVEKLINKLQSRSTNGPILFANRYDGIDLPGRSCGMLVMSGLPAGTSNYELFMASALYGGTTISRMLAQRIEQGIGRGARGSGDHCVILLIGSDLSAWLAKKNNFKFLTNATKAQLEIGSTISKEISDPKDLVKTIKRSYDRDSEWVKYHAETLDEIINEESMDELHLDQAIAERKAINLWSDGFYPKAIDKLDKAANEIAKTDKQSSGWYQQLAARIADHWGNTERAEDLQLQAYANNRNLIRPKVTPPYRPLISPSKQAEAIVEQLGSYRNRRGLLLRFEEIVSNLHHDTTSNKFEQALADLAVMIGLVSERHDRQGEGPDVLWLLPNKIGLVIEVKSRKKPNNPFNKDQHGQLLVAEEWFKKHYKDYQCVRVSVHPKSHSTKAAVADTSHALTYEKLTAMVSDARILLSRLCESQLAETDLIAESGRLLDDSNLSSDHIVNSYFIPFNE